jgi:hypothetical protein
MTKTQRVAMSAGLALAIFLGTVSSYATSDTPKPAKQSWFDTPIAKQFYGSANGSG